MKDITNIFGSGIQYDADDLSDKIYATCTACMSIYSEFLSWANANSNRIVRVPELAKDIIVLSCQVTDLAILNDLRTLESLKEKYPNRRFFIGGCLANRFDIELPSDVLRLSRVCSDYEFLEDRFLVNFENPFWVKDFSSHSKNNLKEGNLFRNYYPLRIGVGCNKTCTYCTIRHTRGDSYTLDSDKLIDEFIDHEDVVLIADSPKAEQIRDWCKISKEYKRSISIRNIEPSVAIECSSDILSLSKKGLLDTFHCPIQTNNIEALVAMKRNPYNTFKLIAFVQSLRKKTNVATNIIVDYLDFKNPIAVDEFFDYVSWNPYWDGKWNRQKAEERFKKYIG